VVQHPAEASDVSLLQSVKTDFGIYPFSTLQEGSFFSRITAAGDGKLATHLYTSIVPRLRMRGTIYPLSHIP